MGDKMSLKDLVLKISYDSDVDDILHDFYIPTLSNSIEYKRSVGFFSSKSLAVSARGISNFIKNGGSMQLICGTKLKNKDLDIVKKAYTNPEEVIEKFFIQELEDLEKGFVTDHIQALGWMVAKEKLNIKIALILDENGIPLTENRGILHQKIGIMKDKDGNSISFSGSNNETAAGWKNNVEEFKVFRSFKDYESEYLKSDIKKFNNLWNGNAKRMKIIEMPIAIKEKLIEIAPEKIEDIKFEEEFKEKKKKVKPIKLYDYQKEAIKNWVDNNKKGIFEMATGTGKTFTALGCLDAEFKNSKQLLCIITAPYQHLVKQWQKSIKSFGIEYDDLIIADSSNRSWKTKATDSIYDMELGYKNKVIILTTHRSFSSKDFKKIFNNKTKFNIFLIADEVHGLGAEYSKSGLSQYYNLRLGLSATPKRYFDECGTEILNEFFSGIVYEFDLEKAINTTNPYTGETYLTPFIYKSKFLELENNELDEYIKITKSIAVNYVSKPDKNKKNIDFLLFKRANILKNANGKYKVLEQIIDDIGKNLKWTIIYCTENQIEKVMKIISKKRISAHLFTMDQGTQAEKKFDGASEREFILEKFIDGYYKVLIAIKCLDEGVDIPPARVAIMMASSGNPREHIQRLGRIIRRYPGKNKSIIHDMFVLPSLSKLPSKYEEIERKIFEKEFERYEEIASIAINNTEALEEIYDAKYKLR